MNSMQRWIDVRDVKDGIVLEQVVVQRVLVERKFQEINRKNGHDKSYVTTVTNYAGIVLGEMEDFLFSK